MNLTDEQVQSFYPIWTHPEERDLPNITLPSDYDGTHELHCVPSQHTNVTPSQQKSITKSWCEKIRESTKLERIWFHSRVSQELFDSACRAPSIKLIFIKWSSVKLLDSLKHCPQLEHLAIGSSSQIQSIVPLAHMKSLVTLKLENLKRIDDFSILSSLTQLEGLSLSGGMWNTLKIPSLGFLESLVNLRYLDLGATRLIDRSIDPILRLQKLESFWSSWSHHSDDLKRLKDLPNLKYGNLEVILESLRNKKK